MLKISHLDGTGNHPSCFSDLAITDNARYPHKLVLTSLCGDDSSVKAIAAAIAEHREVKIEVPNPNRAYPDVDYLRAEGRHRILATKMPGGHTHVLVLSRRFLSSGAEPPELLLNWQGNLEAALLHWLGMGTTLPVLPTWITPLLAEAQDRRLVLPLAIHTARPLAIAAAAVETDESPWEETLSDLIRNGRIHIPEGPGSADPHIAALDPYLAAWAPALAERAQGAHRPRFVPGEDRHRAITSLAQPLYGPQADVAEGLARALAAQKTAMLVGEMGVGKTRVAIATAQRLFSARAGYRALVLHPKHLQAKWPREVTAVVPAAKITVLRSWKDALALQNRPITGPEWYFLARDTSKLGYFSKPAVTWGEARTPRWAEAKIDGAERRTLLGIDRESGWRCPDCGALLRDKDNVPVPRDWFDTRRTDNTACPLCGARLWQADSSRIRRFAPAEFIHHHLRGFFDLLVADECHQLGGQQTAQGNALGSLAASCEYTLAMTGTILNGYASSLHALLWRLDPSAMAAENMEYHRPLQWIERYGVVERVTRIRQDEETNAASRGRPNKTSVHEKPGISPLVFSRHLINRAAFVTLEDVAPWLPPYREIPEPVEMDHDLAVAYKILERELLSAVQQALANNSKRLLGAYVQTLLGYPDRPWDWPDIRDPADHESVIASPPRIAEDALRAKEQRLAEICQVNAAAHRGTVVFVQFTGAHDILPRLQTVLGKKKLRVAVLRADTVPVENREEWITRQERAGAQVLLCHPKLVETGMDLIAWPECVWFQPGHSVYTLRQASRRAWRIGQKEPVNIHYLVYAGTMQSAALMLMSKKLEAAEAIEGRLNSEGLKALAGDQDGTFALARMLVGGLHGLQTAEDAWRSAVAAPNPFSGPAPQDATKLRKQTLADLSHLTRVITQVEGKGRHKAHPGQIAIDFDALERMREVES